VLFGRCLPVWPEPHKEITKIIIGSQPGSSMKLGLAIRAMVAADVKRLKLFGNADSINRINRI
jgi:hypothetical protein